MRLLTKLSPFIRTGTPAIKASRGPGCIDDKRYADLWNRVDKSIPCAVDQPPSETLPTGLWDEFLDFCDDLAPSIKDHQLCCDAGQFQTLKKEMRSAEVIGIKRCPGCYRAFKNLMCQMTCSPKQADFIVVNATRNDDRGTGPALQEIVYGLDKEFADALFNTCNKARSNLYVKLTTLMCGQYTNRCSATKFLSFLGSTDTEGGYSPFRIRHLLLSDANRTLKVKSYLGSEITLHRQQWKLHNTCKIEGST
ncbi:Niemann-Pick C1 protein-like [Varroa jacobsoni]|uniref:Niemann-Pick C1 protein-like n=1 Tax=Varroa jacobsoni TaxID=62625 RepID=UPI000BF4C7E6|nr:Niemann-Pick C1 protein-like [Varroa jacobsoni]